MSSSFPDFIIRKPQCAENRKPPGLLKAMSKPRRTTSSPSVSVSRTPSSPPEEAKKSIRLKVKMPSSKLREMTATAEERRHHNIFTDPVIITGPRNSRSKRRIVEVDTDDEDEDDYNSRKATRVADAEGDEESDDDDVDADADDDGDIDMDDIDDVVSRPTVTVTPAAAARVRNTDAKTGSAGDDDDDDDEPLSELGSEDEAAPSGVGDEEIEEIEEDNDEEDEEEEEEQEEMRDDEDDISESELGTPADTSTLDISKMTKRQRGHLGGDYLQLPMGEFYSCILPILFYPVLFVY